jgi:hypothetical protein
MVTKNRARALGVVVLICTLFYLSLFAENECNASSIVPWEDHPIHDYGCLLFADLVVQGTVVETKVEMVPIEELRKNVPPGFAGRYGRVSKVVLKVVDVLKGYESFERLAFVFHESVRAPSLRKTGTDVIVGLVWNEKLLGGSYELKLAEGLYAFNGETWVSQGEVKGGREHSLAELRAKLDSVSMEHLSKEASTVLIGTVVSINDSIYRGDGREYGLIRNIKLRVDRVIEGTATKEITVTSVVDGTYWPNWRYQMPRGISVGNRYYVFAGDDEEIVYVLGGVNGFFRVDEDRLLYNNRFLVPQRETEFSAKVRQYRKEVR